MSETDNAAVEREHPTCTASGPHYFPEQCRGESAWVNAPATPDAADASTGASEPLSEDVEALAAVVYQTDTLDMGGYTTRDAQKVARAILASDWLAAREAAARAEERERIAQAIENDRDKDGRLNALISVGMSSAARIAREPR
jgi:hypothetical protein